MKIRLIQILTVAFIIFIGVSCISDKNSDDPKEYFMGCWESYVAVPFGNSFIKYKIYSDSVRYDYFYPLDTISNSSGSILNYRWSEAKFNSWNLKFDSLFFENGNGTSGVSNNGNRTIEETKSGMIFNFKFKKINNETLELQIDSIQPRLFNKCIN